MHRIVSPEPQVGSHAVPRPGKGFTVGYVVPTRIIIYIIRDSVRQCECRSAMESTPYCARLKIEIWRTRPLLLRFFISITLALSTLAHATVYGCWQKACGLKSNSVVNIFIFLRSIMLRACSFPFTMSILRVGLRLPNLCATFKRAKKEPRLLPKRTSIALST